MQTDSHRIPSGTCEEWLGSFVIGDSWRGFPPVHVSTPTEMDPDNKNKHRQPMMYKLLLCCQREKESSFYSLQSSLTFPSNHPPSFFTLFPTLDMINYFFPRCAHALQTNLDQVTAHFLITKRLSIEKYFDIRCINPAGSKVKL